MNKVFATFGDIGRTISATLFAERVAVDLSTSTIDCYLLNLVTGAVVEVTGLAGSEAGVVGVELPSTLPVGTWAMEFQVVGGVTYPGDADDRPIVVVRPEVS
jgi:hypothetical protein